MEPKEDVDNDDIGKPQLVPDEKYKGGEVDPEAAIMGVMRALFSVWELGFRVSQVYILEQTDFVAGFRI